MQNSNLLKGSRGNDGRLEREGNFGTSLTADISIVAENWEIGSFARSILDRSNEPYFAPNSYIPKLFKYLLHGAISEALSSQRFNSLMSIRLIPVGSGSGDLGPAAQPNTALLRLKERSILTTRDSDFPRIIKSAEMALAGCRKAKMKKIALPSTKKALWAIESGEMSIPGRLVEFRPAVRLYSEGRATARRS